MLASPRIFSPSVGGLGQTNGELVANILPRWED